ncbi:hypothetical protein QJS04_geneDACA020702 [Acorus gramineus]|uniref:Uncharacterized protein n=1 Tax=Acorus gramineus TaxID=55184 RepID=A0AAV9BV91_ACOGR|nr:hypothetical protein QJS04_geneDACA020702 [Acorus gramineus]
MVDTDEVKDPKLRCEGTGTYKVTLQKGAKTVNSLHLKQCIRSFSVFDFLTDVVSKVPDLGGSEAHGDERVISRRSKK